MKTITSIKTLVCSLGLFTMLFAVSCKSSEPSVENTAALNQLEQQLTNGDFKIDINTVFPFNTNATTQVLNNLTRYTGNTANRINVNGYELTFKNDSIMGQLPYYGEQRMGRGAYGTTMGVVLNGKPTDYSLTKHPKKEAYIMQFDIDDGEESVENYKVIITFYTSNIADLTFASSHRNSISYRGEVKPIE